MERRVAKTIGSNSGGTEERIAVWENEGGSVKTARGMTGAVNQIASTNQIKTEVNTELDRVAYALRSAATKQSSKHRMD
jgi:hypothetical protein